MAADITDTTLIPLTLSSAATLPFTTNTSSGFEQNNHNFSEEGSRTRNSSVVSGQCQWYQRPMFR